MLLKSVDSNGNVCWNQTYNPNISKHRKCEYINMVYYVYPMVHNNKNNCEYEINKKCSEIFIIDKYTHKKHKVLRCTGKELPYILGQNVRQIYSDKYEVYVYLQYNTINLLNPLQMYKDDESYIIPCEHTYMCDDDKHVQFDPMCLLKFIRNNPDYSIKFDIEEYTFVVSKG